MQKITMPVTYDEYAPELSDQCAFNVACLANVKDTNFEFFSQDDFRVRKPDITIKVDSRLFLLQENVRLYFTLVSKAPSEVPLGKQFDVTVSLVNPLPIELNYSMFVIEGAGLGQPMI